MAYSNYRGGWIRDRDERSRGPGGRERDQQQWQGDEERDIDDSRRARESMRDHFSYEGRGGYGGSSGRMGPHRGRGPRGYRRSDDRIKEDVCDCLTEDDRLDATDIEIMVKDGEVQLTGFVASREEKRWAEALAERISGVKDVQNSLRVQDQQRNQGAGAAAGASGAATPGKDKGKDIQH